MADSRLTLVINLSNASVSQYVNYDFNSIALRSAGNPQMYGANSDGLFLLDGAENDNGTNIDCWLTSMKSAMSDYYQTNFLRGYLNYRATDDIKVRATPDGWVVSSDGNTVDSTYVCNSDINGAWHTDYVDLDTGAWGNQWQFKISNTNGCDLSIRSLQLVTAARKNAPVFAAIKGLNNRIDPALIAYNPRTGVQEMAELVNMYVDNSLHAHRRQGYKLITPGRFHSLWCGSQQQDVYVAMDGATTTALYRIMPDGSGVGIRNDLTLGARLWYTWYNGNVYYGNGYENGILSGSVSRPWALTPPHPSEVVIARQFYPAPPGTMMTTYNGRIYMVQGNTIWASEWASPGRWRLAKESMRFEGDITMLENVGTGMYVSDSARVYFLQHTFHMGLLRMGSGDLLKITRVCDYPAIPGTATATDGSRVIGRTGQPMQGLSVVWTSTEGICAADSTGAFHNLTEHKLTYPVSNSGTGIVLARHGKTPGMPVLYIASLAG
jgi:hypothetical protein